jgi:predicted nucleotidyltransferase
VHLLGDAEVLSDLDVVVVVNVFASYFTDKKGKRKARSDTGDVQAQNDLEDKTTT